MNVSQKNDANENCSSTGKNRQNTNLRVGTTLEKMKNTHTQNWLNIDNIPG